MTLTNDFLRQTDPETDADSPLIERVFQGVVSNTFHNNAIVKGDGSLATGNPTSISTTTVTDTAPSTGDLDNAVVGMILEFLDGLAMGRYGVISTGSNAVTLDTDVGALGATTADEYQLIYGTSTKTTDQSHTHDGADSPGVSSAAMVNYAEGGDGGQDIADAISDPDGNRPTTADRDAPFATIADTSKSFELDAIAGSKELQRGGTNDLMTRTTAGTTDAEVDLSSIIPLGSRTVQIVGPCTYSGANRSLEWHIYNTDSPQTGFGSSRLMAEADSDGSSVKRFNGFLGPLAGSASVDNCTTQIFTCPVTVGRKVKLKLVTTAGVTAHIWSLIGWTK